MKRTRRPITPHDALAALAVTVLAASCGCRPGPRSGAGPLVVLAGGDTEGWVVPCGCTSNQSGGLPRRASCVAGLRSQADVLLVDVGGAASGTSPYDRLRFEAILEGELAMGIAAHNIGASEARLGPEYLRRVAQRLGLPLVSANATDARGRPIAEPLRLVEAAGLRVAFVGVLDQRFADEEIRVTPPREAVLNALGRADEPYDVVVVLAYLPSDSLRRLAESLPEADLVLGGPTGQPIPPETIGPTLLTSATNKGKFLAHCQLGGSDSPTRFRGKIIELDESFPDDPQLLAMVRTYYRRLADRDFTPDQTPFADRLLPHPADYRLAGTQSCGKCHPAEYETWATTAHAHAWESVEKQGAHVDPECQRCHVTGYGLPGGFASVRRTPEMVQVGCESCHGPSQSHVADPAVHTSRFATASTSCIECHDAENSPHFDYETYWTRIRHGGPAPSGRPSAIRWFPSSSFPRWFPSSSLGTSRFVAINGQTSVPKLELGNQGASEDRP